MICDGDGTCTFTAWVFRTLQPHTKEDYDILDASADLYKAVGFYSTEAISDKTPYTYKGQGATINIVMGALTNFSYSIAAISVLTYLFI